MKILDMMLAIPFFLIVAVACFLIFDVIFSNAKSGFAKRVQLYLTVTLTLIGWVGIILLGNSIYYHSKTETLKRKMKKDEYTKITSCMKEKYGMTHIIWSTWETKNGTRFTMQTNEELKECQVKN